MMMTPSDLLALIDARAAEDAEFAALVAARNDTAIAAALSTGRTRIDPTTKFASLGIAERHGALNGLPGPLAAELVLQKLEGFAALAVQSPDPATKLLGGAVQRQMKHLEGSGMAVGSPAVAAMLAVIVQADGITQAEADALVAVARVADPIGVDAVSMALNSRGA